LLNGSGSKPNVSQAVLSKGTDYMEEMRQNAAAWAETMLRELGQ